MKNYSLKFIFVFAIVLFSHLSYASIDNKIFDSVAIYHYNINLKISGAFINGYTTLKISPNYNEVRSVNLHLLKLGIDSIYFKNTKVNYSYNDTVINIKNINFSSLIDTSELIVYYHGYPVKDASQWGGYYNTSGGVFNMGVGMDADPHSYGRVWYPCVDLFDKRATYDFNITVANNLKAVCNGNLIETIVNTDNTKTYHWKLTNTIPTYLACFAVANYISIKDTLNGIYGKVPIELNVKAVDSLDVILSTTNLKNAINAFEYYFGPHKWQRVGYVAVPFSGGAMEHATNISYPESFFNGNLQYEDVLVHELGHSWFGNLVTCASNADMWLNEGITSYTEAMFKEYVYGKEAAKTYVRDNHKAVMLTSSVGNLSVYGLPNSETYSNTVYKKGSLMTHNLRGYMGDSLFFGGVKSYLNQYQYKHATTEDFKNVMSNYSGIDLNSFFNTWIYGKGYVCYNIDSLKVTSLASNSYNVIVFVRQKMRGESPYMTKNRLEVTFMDNQWNKITKLIEYDGVNGSDTITIPFNPSTAMIDLEEKYGDASFNMYKIHKTTGLYNYQPMLCSLEVNNISDSALIQITFNRVVPDNITNSSDLVITNTNFWTIAGVKNNQFNAKMKFNYVKNNTQELWLLSQGVVDSLKLLYRKGAWEEWRIVKSTRTGTVNGGYLIVDTLQFGEYAIGLRKKTTNIIEFNEKNQDNLIIYPNPANEKVVFEIKNKDIFVLNIYNSTGVIVDSIIVNNYKFEYNLNSVLKNAPGIYFVRALNNSGEIIAENKIIITK